MTTYASHIHDALRSQGLVPPEEDVHFGACSVVYRTRLFQAFGDDDYEDPELLKVCIGDLEMKIERLTDQVRDLELESEFQVKKCRIVEEERDSARAELDQLKTKESA